jgi:2-methylisocitrate lyase-like PEP mutase family enzyme
LPVTINRAKRYEEVGADGLFVTAVADAAIIKEMGSGIILPLNVLISPQLLFFKAQADCGVERISMMVRLYKATYNQLSKTLKGITATQIIASLF